MGNLACSGSNLKMFFATPGIPSDYTRTAIPEAVSFSLGSGITILSIVAKPGDATKRIITFSGPHYLAGPMGGSADSITITGSPVAGYNATHAITADSLQRASTPYSSTTPMDYYADIPGGLSKHSVEIADPGGAGVANAGAGGTFTSTGEYVTLLTDPNIKHVVGGLAGSIDAMGALQPNFKTVGHVDSSRQSVFVRSTMRNSSGTLANGMSMMLTFAVMNGPEDA